MQSAIDFAVSYRLQVTVCNSIVVVLKFIPFRLPIHFKLFLSLLSSRTALATKLEALS